MIYKAVVFLLVLIQTCCFSVSGQALEGGQLPALIPFRKGELWGYASPNSKKIMITPKYHEVKFFKDGQAMVRMEKGWGIIDESGKEIIKPEYKVISPLTQNLYIVQSGKKYGAFNEKGKLVIPLKYSHLGWNGKLLTAGIGWGRSFYDQREKQRYYDSKSTVLLNSQGKVISKKYESIDFFSEGLAIVTRNLTPAEHWNWVSYNKDEDFIYGYIDTTGREVIPLNLLKANSFKEGRAHVLPFNDKPSIGFFDRTGVSASKFQYSEARPYDKGLAQVKKDNRWGAIDLAGNTVIDYFYSAMSPFNQFGLSVVRFEEYIPQKTASRDGYWQYKMGVINRKGEAVVPLRKWLVDEYKPNGFAKISLEEYKVGRVNTAGKIILAPNYRYIYDIETGFLITDLNNKSAYFNKEGKEIIPFGKYDEIGEAKDGRMLVIKSGLFGYINKQGKEVIPIQYKVPPPNTYGREMGFAEGRAIVCKDNKCGFIDTTGKVVVPLKYEKLYPFNGGWAQIVIDQTRGQEQYGVVNKQGLEVLLPKGQMSVGATGNLLRITEKERIYGFLAQDGTFKIPVKYFLNYYQKDAYDFQNGLLKVLFTQEELAAMGRKSDIVADTRWFAIKGFIDLNGVEYYED